MTSDRKPDMDAANADWQRIWDLFHRVLERPAAEREDFLDDVCDGDAGIARRVRKLLRANAAGTDAMPAIPDAVLTDLADTDRPLDPGPGEQIDQYRLEEIVGEGGMGLVYRASQIEPVRRQVALKLLQLGLATRDVLARFESERQVLALMNHSSIAQVYDAGATALGRPYFVMEFVDGVPVTVYCDRERLGVDARLRIFLRICDGVSHAHLKGIIHRDIKPGNVLVATENGRPVPKIIDFGIAKAIDQHLGNATLHTQLGSLIGTPGHMSPEQAGVSGLDVDMRADVYSLGVLLYQLLVGVLPFDMPAGRRGIADIQDAIRSSEPVRPGQRLARLPGNTIEQLAHSRGLAAASLSRHVDGDIGWIALKAMEKNREQRYPSVAELAADVRRCLGGLPVEARAPTATYRTMRFARRHQLGVSFAATLSLLVLLFAGFMTAQTLRLRLALADTELERNRAEQVSTFMTELFDSANPNTASGEEFTARHMLDAGAARLKTELENQPELRARLLATVAEAYRALGGGDNAAAALELLNLAVGDLQGTGDGSGSETGPLLTSLGEVYHDLGDYELAERYYRQAAGTYRANGAGDSEGLADALVDLGSVYADIGKLGEAETVAREGLDMMIRVQGERGDKVAIAMVRLGDVLRLQGKLDEAVPLMQKAVDIKRSVYGPQHAHVASSLNFLAIAQRLSGDTEGAQAALREAVAIYRKTHGDDHPYLASTLSNLAIAYNQGKQYAAAAESLEEALRIGIASYGPTHPNVNSFRINRGTTLQDLGRYADAEPLLREGLRLDRQQLDPQSPYLLSTLDRLGWLLDGLGNPDEAVALLQEVTDLRREIRGATHEDTGTSYHYLAMSLLNAGELERAAAASGDAMRILDTEANTNPERLAQSLHGLGRIHLREGNLEEAGTLLDRAMTLYEASASDTVEPAALVRIDIAALAAANGDFATAQTRYTQAAAVLREQLPTGHPALARIEVALGRSECRIGSNDAGLARIEAARPLLEQSLAADNWQLALVDAAAGDCHTDRGDYALAERTLVPSLEIVRNARGEQHFLTVDIGERLDRLYALWGQDENAGQ